MPKSTKKPQEPAWKQHALREAHRFFKGEQLKTATKWIDSNNCDEMPSDYGEVFAKLLFETPEFKDSLNQKPKKTKVNATKRADQLQKLAGRPGELAEDREILTKMLLKPARALIESLDLERWVQQFGAWLLRTLKKSPPQKNLECVLFALWEMSHEVQFDIGLFGTKKYKGFNESSYWYDWEPKIYFSSFDGAKGLWKRLQDLEEEAWSVILGLMIIVTKAYLRRNLPKFQKASGLEKVVFTIGFVEAICSSCVRPNEPQIRNKYLRSLRGKRRATCGAARGRTGGWFIAIGTTQGIVFAPAKENEDGTDHRANRIPKQEKAADDLQGDAFAGVDSGFSFGGDALQVARQDDGVLAVRTFRGGAGVGPQIGKTLAAMPASAGENIAAQARARLPVSGRPFNISSANGWAGCSVRSGIWQWCGGRSGCLFPGGA
jgi:hypothetical protein